jgi:hypothetical protein
MAALSLIELGALLEKNRKSETFASQVIASAARQVPVVKRAMVNSDDFSASSCDERVLRPLALT